MNITTNSILEELALTSKKPIRHSNEDNVVSQLNHSINDLTLIKNNVTQDNVVAIANLLAKDETMVTHELTELLKTSADAVVT